MAEIFPFEVHTPYRPFFKDDVEAVTLTLVDGEIGIYASHSPFIAPTKTCILKIKDKNSNWKTAFVSNGFIEMKKHKAILVIDTAEWPEEIDRERAEASQKQAEENLKNAMMKYEVDQAKEKIRRAELRLKAASEAPSRHNSGNNDIIT